MELQFVKQNTLLYNKAVNLRVEAFFKGMTNSLELVNDQFENAESYYLVGLKNQQVIATGRLHIKERVGVVSQMAVHKNYQKQGLGVLS